MPVQTGLAKCFFRFKSKCAHPFKFEMPEDTYRALQTDYTESFLRL